VSPNSGNAVKTYVDANINLTPATATNDVGQPHPITAAIQQNDGLAAGPPGDTATGFGPAPDGTIVVFSLTNNGGATATFVPDGIDSNLDGNTGNDCVVSGGA